MDITDSVGIRAKDGLELGLVVLRLDDDQTCQNLSPTTLDRLFCSSITMNWIHGATHFIDCIPTRRLCEASHSAALVTLRRVWASRLETRTVMERQICSSLTISRTTTRFICNSWSFSTTPVKVPIWFKAATICDDGKRRTACTTGRWRRIPSLQ